MLYKRHKMIKIPTTVQKQVIKNSITTTPHTITHNKRQGLEPYIFLFLPCFIKFIDYDSDFDSVIPDNLSSEATVGTGSPKLDR